MRHSRSSTHGGHPMEGSIFVDDRGRRMCQGSGRAFPCDENGRRINARSIMRPPSYSPIAWSNLTDPVLRRKAWDRFWGGQDPPLAANTRAAAAARLSSLHSAVSRDEVPSIWQYVYMQDALVSRIRAALDVIKWPRSPRTYVPGQGFCVGASCCPKGALFQRPRRQTEIAATKIINSAIRASCHESFRWTSLQFNEHGRASSS